ncbi:Carboxylic ester hydrolase [Mycena venus]|uniref:Carboxylic ester hydrolase n=1 Tax=Mycena venus TaxID=2733690 RepID=A0A8H7D908_9AGAR|nr:Carboxylic ester hydrolase [Mycena venus]
MLFRLLYLPLFFPHLLVTQAVSLSRRTSSATVTLGHTKVIGTANLTTNIDFFGGVPFASSPLGTLRFEAPVLQTSFPQNVTTFDATAFGDACIQLSHLKVSEDCLKVDIFRPAGTSAQSNLPVMFWIHGGGLKTGGSPGIDPSALIARSVIRGTPIVYVATNYRMGPFGFPVGNEVNVTGGVNLGVKDVLVALNWVQANIQVFGGDPTKVTIFGESAGATLSSLTYMGNHIAGLARGAIFASGSPSNQKAGSAPEGQPVWERFVGNVTSCAAVATSGSTLGCMKNVSTAELLEAYATVGETGWTLIVDGDILPALPSVLFAQGDFAKLPFMAGDVLDEGTLFVPQVPMQSYSSDMIKAALTQLYSPPVPSVTDDELSDKIDELLMLYPDDPALGSPYNTGNETFGLPSGWKRSTSIFGDLHFQSTRRLWMQAAASQSSPIYSYLFTQPQTEDPSLGVNHKMTKEFFFGLVQDDGVSSDAALSLIMMDYWLSFANSLDPNDRKGTTRPAWGRYTAANNAILQLNGQDNGTVMIKDDFRTEGINAINENPLIFYH